MTRIQRKAIAQLEITDPLENHIKIWNSYAQDGKHIVTTAFLEMYQKELLEYKELKILILEAFAEQDNGVNT